MPQVELRDILESDEYVALPKGSFNPNHVQSPPKNNQITYRLRLLNQQPWINSPEMSADDVRSEIYSPLHPNMMPEPRRRSTRLSGQGFNTNPSSSSAHDVNRPNISKHPDNNREKFIQRPNKQSLPSSTTHVYNQAHDSQRPRQVATKSTTWRRPQLNRFNTPDSTSCESSAPDPIPELNFNPWPDYHSKFGALPGLNNGPMRPNQVGWPAQYHGHQVRPANNIPTSTASQCSLLRRNRSTLSRPNIPPLAHSSLNNNPMFPNNIQNNAFVGQDFVPKAQPVRSAYEDFIQLAAASIPGININELLHQITTNPCQPIQLSVPGSFDATQIQTQLQRALEQAINNQCPPSIPPAAHQNGLLQPSLTNNIAAKKNEPPPPPPPTEDEMAEQDMDADADQDEEFQEVETYADYVPAKFKLGLPHPDPVVETSSLSTVEPPDVIHKLSLPCNVLDKGLLSSLQLESVVYACQQHSQFMADGKFRRGFLIGDGAGVGKGRTIAGIIFENYLQGRKKSIWLSVSTDLKLDAERDLKDIGAKIPVHVLGKFIYGRKINIENCVIFTTYSGLVSKSQSVKGPLGTRLGQLVAWAGSNFDGVIVFDECHKAKNISITTNKKTQSKAAEFVLELQDRLPKARVVYASATGASETKHLGYMTRLGIWGPGTPYATFTNFCESIEKRGVGAMELVAVDLKMRGSYIARQLSFKTTSFQVRIAGLNDDFIKLYDDCVDLWSKALNYFTEASGYFYEDKGMVRTIWRSFWSTHQRFFKYLCIGAKVPTVVEIAKHALDDGKCVVIGLQSTGEAKTIEALDEGDINEFISTAKATFESLIDNHFPAPASTRRKFQSKLLPEESSNSSTDILTRADKSEGEDEDEDSENSKPFAKRFKQKEQALKELAKLQEKKKRQSTRAMRAKRRREATHKSRVRLVDDSSDTELSNPLSDTSPSSSAANDKSSNDSSSFSPDSSSETEEFTSDSKSSSDHSPKRRKLNSSPSNAKKSSFSDSDSDIQITAVKKKQPDIIILSSSDEEMDEQETNPMKRYGKRLTQMRDELYQGIEALGPRLPNNTLDDLIDRLGGPEAVAEMTGRKGHVVKNQVGQVSYKHRNSDEALDELNIVEKHRFMNGEKLIAIISEAASSGISLQADKRVRNTRRRVHITVELPWSADRAIQQFGRTHRSNQVSGPEYVFVISELAGERRFASIVAKRLESLGALTHGDRRATSESRDLSQFNLAGRFSKQALELLCLYIQTGSVFARIKPDYNPNTFLRDARDAFVGSGLGIKQGDVFTAETSKIAKVNLFLNRILGMKVRIQNALFKLFTDYTERLIIRKKVAGLFDSGILELNSQTGKTRCDDPEDFFLKTSGGIVKCSLRNVQVERGISWDEALRIFESSQDSRSGFYITVNPITKAKMVTLLIREPSQPDLFRAHKPNTGRQSKPDLYANLAHKSKKVDPQEAKSVWCHIFNFTDEKCVHLCLFNTCKRIQAKMRCDIGLRHRKYCILSGGILTAWPFIEKRASEITKRLQIVRLKLDSNNRVIGPIVPQDHVDRVRELLRRGQEEGVEF